MDTIGRYKLVDTIGHGQFGKVFQATISDSISVVAIKKIPIETIFKEDLVNDMKKIIISMQTLHHKNIVGAQEVIKSSNHLCIVMPHVKGVKMIDLVGLGAKLSNSISCKYSNQICDALAYCHSQGISHRNLNPWNVIIDNSDSVKLTGFDLINDILIGDEVYGDFISPEIRDTNLQKGSGAKQDMWAFGILVYYMTMGKMPENCINPFGKKSFIGKLQRSHIKNFKRVVLSTVVVLPDDRQSAETVLACEWFYNR